MTNTYIIHLLMYSSQNHYIKYIYRYVYILYKNTKMLYKYKYK